MSKYRAEQDIHISGYECGTEIECKMVVTYRMTEHYPASDSGPEEFPQPEVERIRFFRKRDGLNVEIALPPFIEDAFIDGDEFKSWLATEASDADEAARDRATEDRREELRHG